MYSLEAMHVVFITVEPLKSVQEVLSGSVIRRCPLLVGHPYKVMLLCKDNNDFQIQKYDELN